MRQITANRQDAAFKAQIIHLDGLTGWAEWSSSFTRLGTNDPVRMDGILKAAFDTDQRCTEFRQWWHVNEPGQGSLMRDMDA